MTRPEAGWAPPDCDWGRSGRCLQGVVPQARLLWVSHWRLFQQGGERWEARVLAGAGEARPLGELPGLSVEVSLGSLERRLDSRPGWSEAWGCHYLPAKRKEPAKQKAQGLLACGSEGDLLGPGLAFVIHINSLHPGGQRGCHVGRQKAGPVPCPVEARMRERSPLSL